MGDAVVLEGEGEGEADVDDSASCEVGLGRPGPDLVHDGSMLCSLDAGMHEVALHQLSGCCGGEWLLEDDGVSEEKVEFHQD